MNHFLRKNTFLEKLSESYFGQYLVNIITPFPANHVKLCLQSFTNFTEIKKFQKIWKRIRRQIQTGTTLVLWASPFWLWYTFSVFILLISSYFTFVICSVNYSHNAYVDIFILFLPCYMHILAFYLTFIVFLLIFFALVLSFFCSNFDSLHVYFVYCLIFCKVMFSFAVMTYFFTLDTFLVLFSIFDLLNYRFLITYFVIWFYFTYFLLLICLDLFLFIKFGKTKFITFVLFSSKWFFLKISLSSNLLLKI